MHDFGMTDRRIVSRKNLEGSKKSEYSSHLDFGDLGEIGEAFSVE